MGLSQTLLGSHNTLKLLLSGHPLLLNKPPVVTPPRNLSRKASFSRKIPLSPINSASTPISRLKHATEQLGLLQGIAAPPLRFEDIEVQLPPPKKRRPGRPSKQKSPIKLRLSDKNATASVRRNLRARKPPRIEQFPDEDEGFGATVSPQDATQDSDILPANTRRSSYSNRGKRGLSIGNGFVAKPHSEVSESDYYKLLDPSIPDPNRMRQILSWCFRRAIDKKKAGDDHDDATGEARTAEGIARAIENELLDDIINGVISTSWYSIDQEKSDSTQVNNYVPGRKIICPNPLNETNKESIEVFKLKLQNLRAEKARLLAAYESSFKAVDDLDLPRPAPSTDDLREYLRKNHSAKSVPESVLDNLVPSQIQLCLQETSERVASQFELNVDKLHLLLHGLKQNTTLVSAFGNTGIEPGFTDITHNFVNRVDSTKEPSIKDLLKGIAKMESRKDFG